MSNGEISRKPSDEGVEPEPSESARPSVEPVASPPSNPHQQKIMMQRMESTSFVGPLPPPNVLRGYNEIIPGAAERILAMAERQQSHRLRLESEVVEGNCESQKRGLNFGFVLAMTVILGGLFLIYKGKDITGIIAVVAALGSLVGLFIYGKQKQSKELQSKNKAFQE